MDLSNITSKGCLCSVSISIWGNRKKIPKKYLEVPDADKNMLSGSKRLIDPKELKELTNFRSRVTKLLDSYSLPSPIKGSRFVPKDSIADVDDMLQSMKAELSELVEPFAQRWDTLIREAEEKLGPELFNTLDYPSNVRSKFNIEWTFYEMGLSNGKASMLSPEIYRRETEKLQRQMDDLARNSVSILRIRFKEMLEHIVDRLSGTEKKRFNSDLVDGPKEFYESFKRLNICDDSQLKAQIEKAEMILQGVDPDQLRQDFQFRNHVSDQISEVESKMEEMIIEMPNRWVDLGGDDDDE